MTFLVSGISGEKKSDAMQNIEVPSFHVGQNCKRRLLFDFTFSLDSVHGSIRFSNLNIIKLSNSAYNLSPVLIHQTYPVFDKGNAGKKMIEGGEKSENRGIK